MKTGPLGAVTSAIVLVLAMSAPTVAPRAQDAAEAVAEAPADMAAAAPPQEDQADGAPAYAAPQLDGLVAPVALYPDPLLADILAASTYPLQVVEADRWVADPRNAALKGDQLTAALQDKDWDPSVKSLTAFPQILAMMDRQLDWTEQLGDAFLAQQAKVMDAVQRLRREAQATGHLPSTAQQMVANDGTAISIMPSNPERVYVPAYDPRLIYGPWLDADYPPAYFPVPDYDYGPLEGDGLFFGDAVVVVEPLWLWCDFDWRRHHIRIDHDRFERLHPHHNFENRAEFWSHDPSLRAGTGDPRAPARLRSTGVGTPERVRDFHALAPSAVAPSVVARPLVMRPGASRPDPAPHVAIIRHMPVRPTPLVHAPATLAQPRATEGRPSPAHNFAPPPASFAPRPPAVSHAPSGGMPMGVGSGMALGMGARGGFAR
ncbi:hypothetical protein GCM10011611_38080 [Aliidongia dinghuensis]|uniref:DUF3300 domain-containing protein n=1 Tax=Aliidongia dinghuensis TaxID=1867774 RepID=A0A8J2YVI8_9PROT|nr:DUF3300 domain-containing protein [Aliidongia dinghuensis]GGF28431.1 hypothetical protein GCM10011611_38080 [Aliidongia dinghuensis]